MNVDGDGFDVVKRPLLLRVGDSDQLTPVYYTILGFLRRCPSTSQVKNTIFAGLTFGVVTGLCTAAVRAEDTADENRQLKERVKQLEAIVDKLSQAQEHMEAQVQGMSKARPKQPEVKGDERAQVPATAKAPKSPPPPPPVSVSFTNGLKVDSANGDFSFKIGGRVIVDGGVSNKPFPGVPVAIPPFQPVQAPIGYENQVGIRHALLSIEGTAFKWWDYRLQYEFTGAGSGVPVGGIRDAFLASRHFEPVTFQVGNFFEPFSLGRTDSVLYQTFIERSLAKC